MARVKADLRVRQYAKRDLVLQKGVPGDSLLFDSGAPHGPERLVAKPMTYLSVIMYEKE